MFTKNFIKSFLLCSVALCSPFLFSNCGSDEVEQVTTVNDGPKIQFVIKNLPSEYATRATVNTEAITDIYIWEGKSILCHQKRGDKNFGSPVVSLKVGAHDLTFVASKSIGQSWNNGTWSCSAMRDTYGARIEYTVSAGSSGRQVDLELLTAKIALLAESDFDDASKAVVAVNGGCMSLNDELIGSDAKRVEETFNKSDVDVYVITKEKNEPETVMVDVNFQGTDNGYWMEVSAERGKETYVRSSQLDIRGSVWLSTKQVVDDDDEWEFYIYFNSDYTGREVSLMSFSYATRDFTWRVEKNKVIEMVEDGAHSFEIEYEMIDGKLYLYKGTEYETVYSRVS